MNCKKLNDIDVNIKSGHDQPSIALSNGTSLRFLSVVETSRIPLYLALGSICTVSTADVDTESWFRNILSSPRGDDRENNGSPWWQTARPDSPLGILVALEIDKTATNQIRPRVTEVLFYASGSSAQSRRPLTSPPSSPNRNEPFEFGNSVPSLTVHALLLSSDLLHHNTHTEPTPPSSPVQEEEDIEAVFLPQQFPVVGEVINEPPVRKRKSATDAFDEASERRKKARRKGGEGVAAAAATKSESQIATLKHQRSMSNGQSVPLQTRPISRSPSVSSSRPPTAIAATKRSSLSRVQSVAVTSEESAFENQNKELISRIVMAGMRLYGLSQSKKRKSRASSTAPSPAISESFTEAETERKNDEEYKLVYHQVFKAACFAFRATIERESLHSYSEPVREVVDKLLAIFCSNPLAQALGCTVDKLTPGGRKAFGSSVADDRSPFMTVMQNSSVVT